MSMIDLDKFIVSAIEHYHRVLGIDPDTTATWLDSALEEQGLQIMNGEIVELNTVCDKVETKFKEGDYLVHYCGNVVKVVDVRDDGEYLVDYVEDGLTGLCKESEIVSQFRLWELCKDAKPGDLLSITYACPEGKATNIVLLKHLDGDQLVCGYVLRLYRGLKNEFVIDGKCKIYYSEFSEEMSNGFHPADESERNIFSDFLMKSNLIWSKKKKDLVKYGEQEDDIRFRIGDWVHDVRTKTPFYVKDINSMVVKICSITGIDYTINKSNFLRFNRKWQISDANDGDILVDKNGNTFKFKKLIAVDRCDTYYLYDKKSGTINQDSGQISTDGVVPANAQEIRDLNNAFVKFEIDEFGRQDSSSILLSIKTKLFDFDKTVREDDFGKDTAEVKQWIDDMLRQIDKFIHNKKNEEKEIQDR